MQSTCTGEPEINQAFGESDSTICAVLVQMVLVDANDTEHQRTSLVDGASHFHTLQRHQLRPQRTRALI